MFSNKENEVFYQDLFFALEGVRRDGRALRYVPRNLRTRELCMEAVRQYGRTLEFVPNDLRTLELCMAAVRQNGGALFYVSRNLRTRDLCLEAVGQNGRALRSVPENLENYQEICLEAVRQNGLALDYVPENLENYQRLCLEAVRQDGLALEYVPRNLRTRELCMEAVGKDGRALRHVPDDIKESKQRKDQEIVKAAVKQNLEAIQYVPKTYEFYTMLCVNAVIDNPSCIRFVKTDISGYLSLIRRRIKKKKLQEPKRKGLYDDSVGKINKKLYVTPKTFFGNKKFKEMQKNGKVLENETFLKLSSIIFGV